LPDFGHALTGPFVLGGFSPTYQQDVPEAWALKAGANQFSLSSEEIIEYRVAATSDELKEANWELLESLADGPKHVAFGAAALGNGPVMVQDGAVMVTAVYPQVVFEGDVTPLTVLSDEMQIHLDTLRVTHGPEELTMAGFPAAAAIRTGVSEDGVEITVVTAVVQSNRYLIYMSDYANSDTFEAEFPTLAGMMNSLRILTDEVPLDEAGTDDEEVVTEEETSGGDEGEEAAVGEWATSRSDMFTIDYPANWVGEPFGGFGVWASSAEMEEIVVTLFNNQSDVTLSEGASALVLIGSYNDFGIPADTDLATAMAMMPEQFTSETGLSITPVQELQEVDLNGVPAGYTVVSTELANGRQVHIIMGLVMSDSQMARFAGYVLNDDEAAISLLTEMFLTFEFATAE
ncbi:MAG: hypothetical protein KDE51_26400, partial [Anaerolineales bacterium]|nr:hypothetical protein [Anaerolineales bacterium]